MREKVSITLALMIAGAAQAGAFTEVESNNTLGTANFVGNYTAPGGSILITGAIEENDVDWFEFSLDNTASLSVFAAFAFGTGGDGIMQVVNGMGEVIAFDDDSGVGLMPALQLENLSAGTYYVGISGFGDVFSDSVDTNELMDGMGHSETFGYKLALGFTVIPAPGALALLGLGGLAVTRRRR